MLHLALPILIAAVALAPQSKPRAPGASTPAPPFAFRDWHARDEYRPGDPRVASCVAIAAGHACFFADDRIGGVKARQIGAAFGRAGLFALEAKFPSEHAPVVLAALQQRYGAPCESRTEQPRQVMTGQVVPRTVVTWCFAEGRATYSSITDDRSEASFKFATTDAASQAAVQDF